MRAATLYPSLFSCLSLPGTSGKRNFQSWRSLGNTFPEAVPITHQSRSNAATCMNRHFKRKRTLKDNNTEQPLLRLGGHVRWRQSLLHLRPLSTPPILGKFFSKWHDSQLLSHSFRENHPSFTLIHPWSAS